MAPPIPRVRRPVQRRRTGSDIVIGISAVLALLLLVGGVPIALVGVLGLPLPHAMPSLSFFTHQLGILSVLKILSIVVWLAWLQLLLCVFAEIRAAVKNTGMPGHVPLAGGTQALVHKLVTAALLLVAATTAISPAFAHQAPPRPAHSISASASRSAGVSQALFQSSPVATPYPGTATPAAHASEAHAGQAAHTEHIYVVTPPEGRYHESLWEIAQKHLGDGRRYREIFELNKDRVQPDGSKLTIASLIRPGWVLTMPRDAHGPGIEVVSHHRQTPPEAPRTPEPGPRSAPAQAPAAHQAQPGPGGMLLPTELAAASLLAAGVLSALGRRRREQLWRRAFGTRVAVPGEDAAGAEAALRLGASEPSVRLLDTGLRYLGQMLAASGRTPPTVFAAHIGDQALDLWVAPADQDAPAPWQAVGDGQVWRLPRAAAGALDPDPARATLAPYPGLVSIGTDDTGRVLVDLEAAHGLIALAGPDGMVRAALTAMAVELATNRWSDQMHITLVGFADDLTVLAPDRVNAVATLAEALPMLEERAAEVERALVKSGLGSVLTGRSSGLHPAAWAPHYLITAVPPSPAERERLLALARTRHAAAAGYVIAGEVPGATWAWDISQEGRLRAGLLGFDVAAQLLLPEQHAAVVDLFQVARDSRATELAAPELDAAPEEQLVPGAAMAVEVTLLGPLTVQAAGEIEKERVPLATEVVSYLAAHPGGVHPNVLAGAVWPRGVSAEVREATLARVAGWLGTDEIGRPQLATDAGGRLRLGSQVRVDWHVFLALVARAARAARSPDSAGRAEEATFLQRALELVRGQLMDGREPGRYAWLATDDLEYEVTARVADAAHRLSVLRLAGGDARGAMAAARLGLRLAFNDELLWRDLLTAAHATGQEAVLRAVVDEIRARTQLDEVLPKIAPETESLIDELLPSWRSSVA
ncbi:MAG: hypothetical protein LBI49_06815 [Nocardiopsaceae bacterium]|jgi:hypothetical protein|nr:hypothetical protein [Nocardiopsaceae bacterium]